MAYFLKSKEDWLKLADDLCQPLSNYRNTADSTVRFPVQHAAFFSNEDASFECFARPLWAISGLVRNGNHELGSNICCTIKNGTDPLSEVYWGDLKDYSQRIVDVPAIAFFLCMNKDLFDEEFDQEEKQRVVDWLLQINNVEVYHNNWLFFPIIVNAAVLNLGLGGSRDAISNCWNALDEHYRANGWYSDGPSQQRDYYIAWGYHFYSLISMYIDPGMPLDRKEAITSRAEIFATSFKWFFDDSGEAVPIGRSLIYRFAQVAFWSAYKLCGLDGQSDKEVKSIISENLNWWLERNIFNPDGTLNIGYAYENHFVAEPYSAEGSPYWAFKTFVILLIPDDSPFWDADSDSIMTGDINTFVDGGDFYISRAGGITMLYPLHMKTKNPWPNGVSSYQKFVYSTRFGFCVERGFTDLLLAGADCSLAVLMNNSCWVARHNATKWQVQEGGIIRSVWNVGPKTQITTYIIALGQGWHLRVHLIESDITVEAADCGFSVPEHVSCETLKQEGSVELVNHAEGLFSAAISLYGESKPGSYKPPVNTNILYTRVMVPYLKIKIPSGTSVVVNGFYGGTSEPEQFPKATIRQGMIDVSLGDTRRVLHLEGDLHDTTNSPNTKEAKERNSFGRILRKLTGGISSAKQIFVNPSPSAAQSSTGDERVKVSIIIPVYNVRDYVSTCIGSLKAQSLREIEFIFIDDCSTDDSMLAVEEWAENDARVRIIHNDHNIGAGASRNKGIQAAVGEYIGFVDPDDYISNDFYRLLYNKAKDGAHDIAKGSTILVHADGTRDPSDWLNKKIKSSLGKKQLCYVFGYEHWSAIYKRALFRDPSVKYGTSRCSEDSLFLLSVCKGTNDIVFEPQSEYYYVARAGSLWSTFNKDRFLADLQSMDEKIDYLLNNANPCDDMYAYIAGKGHSYWMNLIKTIAVDDSLATFRKEYETRLLAALARLPKREAAAPLKADIFTRALVEQGALIPDMSKIPPEGMKDAVASWVGFLADHPELDSAYLDAFIKNSLGVMAKNEDTGKKKAFRSARKQYEYIKKRVYAARLRSKSRKEAFQYIYKKDKWGEVRIEGAPNDFYSGPGSYINELVNPYVSLVKKLVSEKDIQSIVDLGCGDFNVGSKIAPFAAHYTGCDIVPELIERNKERFKEYRCSFVCLDMVDDKLPAGDLCLIREVFQHLDNEEVLRILPKLRQYRYVLVTETIEKRKEGLNENIAHGRYRGVSLEYPPFYMTGTEMLRLEHPCAKDSVVVSTLFSNPRESL